MEASEPLVEGGLGDFEHDIAQALRRQVGKPISPAALIGILFAAAVDVCNRCEPPEPAQPEPPTEGAGKESDSS